MKSQPAQAILPANKSKSSAQQTFLDHLRELRTRIFFIAIALVVGSCLAYALHDPIIKFLLSPLGQQKLVYLTPGGGFDFIFKVSLYFGVALTIPVIVFQLYKYLAPLMINKTKRFAAFVIIMSCVLAASGMTFGYFVALPAALEFLTGFAGSYVEASLTASSYLNFVVIYSLGLAAVFQIPLILLLFNVINGPLKPSKLLSSQPYVLLGSLILAAMITPTPDVINQAVVAGPIVLMYQIGVMMVLWQNRSCTNYCSESEQLATSAFSQKTQPVVFQQSIEKVQVPAAPSRVRVPKPKTVVQQISAKPQPRPQPRRRTYGYKKTMDGFSQASQRRVAARPATGRSLRPTSSARRPIRTIDGFVNNSSRRAIDTVNGKI